MTAGSAKRTVVASVRAAAAAFAAGRGNPDGTVTFRRVFRVAAPQTAADAKGFVTSLANCKAKNPMFCPYHGIDALKQKFCGILESHGLVGEDVGYNIEKRPSGAFGLEILVSAALKAKAKSAVEEFLSMPGILDVTNGSGLEEEVGAVFRQDVIKGEEFTEKARLDEMEDRLHEALEDDLIDIDVFTDFLAKKQEYDKAQEKGGGSEEQKKLAGELAELYGLLTSQADYHDVKDLAAASDLMQRFAEQFMLALMSLKSSNSVKQSAMKAALGDGVSKSPVGFPGNAEYNALKTKIAKYDMELAEEAKHLYNLAQESGDLAQMKLAVSKMEKAANAAVRHGTALFHLAQSMIENYGKLGGQTPDGTTHKGKSDWYKQHGIDIPDEFKSGKPTGSPTKGGIKPDGNAEMKEKPKSTEKPPDSPPAATVDDPNKDGSASKTPKPAVYLSDILLQPLAHDEAKFPSSVTQKVLDAAISAGKKFGNSGSGIAPVKVTIDGKSYVIKSAPSDSAAGKAILNGHACDMAYRAGGIHAPDSKLYHFGGKVYKLAEFIDGVRLDSIMAGKDENAKEHARTALLRGYPLDVLFSNWDVLGTNPDKDKHFTNIIFDKDGNPYRIDNDGAFAATGLTGGTKDCHSGNFTSPVEFEDWDAKGGWAKREWIDDFRTMRREKANKGVFDGYSTADIFLAAGRVNMAASVASIPDPSVRKALAKPLFEMNQMARRALNFEIGGYHANNEMLSVALDSSYEASKLGMRELAKGEVHYNSAGFGENAKYAYAAQPFPEPEPVPPANPKEQFDNALPNASYTGGHVASVLVNAAKTINHHAGHVILGKDGKPLGNGTKQDNPDFQPNPSKMAEFEKLDREKIAELAKTDSGAATMLGVYDAIAVSKGNGYKTAVGEVPSLEIKSELPRGYKTEAEKKYEKDNAAVIAAYSEKKAAYDKAHAVWLAAKLKWDDMETKKAVASGKSKWKNFHAFADELAQKKVDTNGVAKGGGHGISTIEQQMHAQKGSSWSACRVKIMELGLMGMSPDDCLKIGDDHPLIHNGYKQGGKDHFMSAAKKYAASPALWAKHLRAYAVYKGLNIAKMENETNPLFDHGSGTVGVFRGIHGQVKTSDGKMINITQGDLPIHQEGSADCCMFEKNSWTSNGQQAYIVPMSRVCYNFHNFDSEGGKHWGYESEQEIAVNLVGMQPHGVPSGSYMSAYKKAKASKAISANMKSWAQRLAPFQPV